MGLPTTPMQLLKLVYLCQGWMLAMYDKPLINEPVEAWQHGPVIPSVYHLYKSFRGDPINTGGNDQGVRLTKEHRHVIDEVLKVYRDYSSADLYALAHRKGTPWDQVHEDGVFGIEIPEGVIRDYYKNLQPYAK